MHLFLMAERMGYVESLHEGFRSTVVGSIGPSTTEGLSAYGVVPDYEPTQSKMGFLVKEVAERSSDLLEQKRNAADLHVPADTPPPPISPLLTGNTMPTGTSRSATLGLDFLHEIGSRMAAADQQ